jgi:hypothetical protein
MNKALAFVLAIFLITGSFIAIINFVPASRIVANSWNTKTPMNHERVNFRVIAVDNKIYAIGGSYQTEIPSYDQWPLFVTNYLGTNECYDPETDTWVTLTTMPSPRVGFAIAAYQGKIYCVGGVTGKSGMYSNLGVNEVYDIATDSWSTKTSPPMFNSEQWVQAQVVNEKIFVIVGSGEDYKFGNLYMYDPQTDVWTEKASIPTSFTTNDFFLISTVIDDKIIVISVFRPDGYPNNSACQLIVMIYNPKTDVWSEGKAGPEIKVGMGPHTVGTTTGIFAPKKAYFFGYSGATMPAQPFFWIYDPVKGTWSIDKAVESYEGGVAVVDDVLYIIRGAETMQYVPIGYHGPLLSETGFSLNIITLFVVVLILTVGVVCGTFFFLKKRKNVVRDISVF